MMRMCQSGVQFTPDMQFVANALAGQNLPFMIRDTRVRAWHLTITNFTLYLR